MRERTGVEHDLRLLALEHRRERLRVTDVAQRERAVVEQRLDDEDLIEAVYGSANFREAVVAFTSGASKK